METNLFKKNTIDQQLGLLEMSLLKEKQIFGPLK